MGIAPSKSTIQEAVAVISSGKIQGVVIFKQKEDYVRIIIDIKGLIKNHKHGFHIHFEFSTLGIICCFTAIHE